MSNGLTYALGLGGLVTFYGLVSLAVFFAGSQFGLQLTEQIVIVALVLLTLPFALVIGYFATRKKKKPEVLEPENQAEIRNENKPPQKSGAPSGRYEELNQSANTAFQFLQSSNLAGGAKGKDAVYALPLFLFAGAPRSGKTSLVLSSGLNFQTLPNQRQSEQMNIRPTRNADWRVSSEAVILDTTGRYQTEGETDADEWSALLELLKKHRSIRPLDGLVLVANAEKLLAADEAEIEHQAKLLRARLDETMQRGKVRFPVYLVFTNADAIEGFRDSFSVSQREGKNNLLGATFPLEKADSGAALFDSEFDALQQSLLKRRLMRLSAPFPPVRQLKIFNFPAHFSSSRRKLGHFVATLFRPNPFAESPLFRGFYFVANLPQNNTVGASYFAEKFFRNVLLRDKDLVATFQANKQRPPVLGWLLLVFGALVITFLLAASGIALYLNKRMLDDAAARGKRVQEIVEADKGRDPLTKDPNSARAEIEAVENLRETMATLDKYEREGAPLWMRFGMYSGRQIYLGDRTNQGLFGIYSNAVEQRFKKPVVKHLEEDLRKFAANQTVLSSANLTDEQEKDLGRHYDLLKAYLMLSSDFKTRAEPIFLTSQLADYWKRSAPPELENLSNQQLAFYAAQVDRAEFPTIPLDKNLVDAARKRLQAYPAVFRYYKRVTTDIDKKVDAVSVESALAGRSAGVLEGSYKVPGSFTIEGYRGEMQKAITNAQTELSQPDWVMGEQAVNETATNADIAKLQSRYFNEYTDHWRKFVKSVSVAKYNRKDDAVNALKAFQSTESPMEILVREVARNTNLSATPKPKDWLGWIKSFFEKSDAGQTGGNSEVEREFKPLFDFVKDNEKTEGSAASQYRSAFRPLVESLDNVTDDKVKQISADLAKDRDTLGLRKAESTVNARLEAFTTTAAQDVADLLKKPLQNLRVFFGADAQNQLEKTWREQIFPKAQEIERGFPFNDAGEADLPKLTAYLNPVNGTLSKFYSERLEKYFEEVGGQFKVKESSEVKFNQDFVAYLNNAFRLREALYGKGATPNFEYEFKLQPAKDTIIEASIDGNKITSEGTSSGKFTFPARAGAETGAILQLVSTAEPVSTSGAATNSSANTNAANVSTTTNANVRSNFQQTNSNNAAPGSLRFSGQWGLFRMIDAGTPQKNQNGEYALTFKVGGKTVSASVRPTGGDLFDKNLFRQVRAPQNMLK